MKSEFAEVRETDFKNYGYEINEVNAKNVKVFNKND